MSLQDKKIKVFSFKNDNVGEEVIFYNFKEEDVRKAVESVYFKLFNVFLFNNLGDKAFNEVKAVLKEEFGFDESFLKGSEAQDQ